MLRGSASAKVDQKGRLRIPAEFLPEFEQRCGPGRKVFITSRDGKTARVYPLPAWKAHERALLNDLDLSDPLLDLDPEIDHYLRAVNYWGNTSALDSQFRFLINSRVRDAAELSGKVTVSGKLSYLEVTAAEKLEKQPPIVTEEQQRSIARGARGGSSESG